MSEKIRDDVVGWPRLAKDEETGEYKHKPAGQLADELNKMLQAEMNEQWGNGQDFLNPYKTRAEAGFVMRALPEFSNPGDNNELFLKQMVEMAFQSSGFGSQDAQLSQVLGKFDRFNKSMVPKNPIYSGYTFFTRPRLCLADFNLIGQRKFAAMRTTRYNSVPFALRCMLDTEYSSLKGSHSYEVMSCPHFDPYNPFLVCLSNRLQSISGFIDPSVQIETSEGGFFCEDQTVSIGGERLLRTYDINAQFSDVPGSPIAALFDYYYMYLTNLGDGTMMQYADAIDANRLDYTISIYRFLMDRTNRYIQRWCKCTGCFPISSPTGVPFNSNQGETFVQSASEFSIPFKVNRIEYDDPIILKEFNMLVRRYNNWGKETDMTKKHAFLMHPVNNFAGIPYIRSSLVGNELVWLQRDFNSNEEVIDGSTPPMEGLTLI